MQSLEPNAGVQVAEDTYHSAQQHLGRRAGQKQNLHLCLLVKYARRFSGLTAFTHPFLRLKDEAFELRIKTLFCVQSCSKAWLVFT